MRAPAPSRGPEVVSRPPEYEDQETEKQPIFQKPPKTAWHSHCCDAEVDIQDIRRKIGDIDSRNLSDFRCGICNIETRNLSSISGAEFAFEDASRQLGQPRPRPTTLGQATSEVASHHAWTGSLTMVKTTHFKEDKIGRLEERPVFSLIKTQNRHVFSLIKTHPRFVRLIP